MQGSLGDTPDPNLSFSSARRKELKEASTLSKASPYMGRMQLITGYPPSIKVFVWLSSFRPFGIRHDYSDYA